MKPTIFFLTLIFSYVKSDTLGSGKVAWPSFTKFTTVENNGYIDSTCEEKQGGWCILKSVEILQDITEDNQLTLDYVIKEYDGWNSIGRTVTRDKHENIPFCKPFDDRDEESSILKILRQAMKLPDTGCPIPKQNNPVERKIRVSRVYLNLAIYKCQHYYIEITIKNSNGEQVASGAIILFSQNYYCEDGYLPSY